MKPTSTPPSCATHLAEITIDDLRHLQSFAERRLASFGLPGVYAEDLTSKAIYSVLRGVAGSRGRYPRAKDLETKANFLNFLRGAVASTVEAYTRRVDHRSAPAPGAGDSRLAPDSAEDDIELRDLKRELFKGLRLHSAPSLHATIAAWEGVFYYADQIPRIASLSHARAVRRKAAHILEYLYSEGDGPGAVSEVPSNGKVPGTFSLAGSLLNVRTQPQP